ncbi:SDR family NAD(P)-dependent oxidoreductase [Dietzia psychralcaliphila]|uniref:Short-chain dehydrogenase n=1 Tax=Dietzia psychralcaliphila TaxID=139021 RepID=A0AAD0NNX4_9ACTN|nr:SDR family oxidoreductase [Dietzia psychralcaliphila]AWH94229.1 short-chain dehydrogenase [Dietzia psychralcaliphila]PTM87821.1 NAD(P)-dependent dehydrogenase (short-subunit alcohol dehydrogenase family) [Dietzia psychralcaliphila]
MADDTTGRRHAVVVGGASGIGWATARQLASDGWRVTVADVNGDLAEARVAELAELADSAGLGASTGPHGPGHDHRVVDVVDESSVEALFSGTGPELVVTTAGVSTLGLVTDHDTAEFRRVVDVCLTGAFLVLKHAGRVVGEGGSIVAIASLNARQPGRGMAAYCAAKAGLVMLAQVAALELGERGIRVNTVSPGFLVTPLTEPVLQIPGLAEEYAENAAVPHRGTAEDVARAVLYLADSPWMTGEDLAVDGGAQLRRYPDVLGLATKAFS